MKRYALLLTLVLSTTTTADARQKYWSLSPYNIRLVLAVDASLGGEDHLASELAETITDRVRSTLAPRWALDLVLAEGEDRFALISAPDATLGEVGDDPVGVDKWMFLTVEATPAGYALRCRERDCRVDRWGATHKRLVRQRLILGEACFALLRDTFAPLVEIHTLPEDPDRVEARFKGSELPAREPVGSFASAGDVYLPLIARTDRSGEIREGSTFDMPWTYLTLAEPEGQGWLCEVHSGTKNPYGLRRRGRILRLALAVRNRPAPTRVRFYARHDKNLSLTGYEVFRRVEGAKESEPLGLTDTHGSIVVDPVATPVQNLFLRSDGQLLAKVPVAAGVKPVVEVPIADDTARLRAQAQLTSLRQELMDLVARRTILIARARKRLEAGDVPGARQLLNELDDLPSRAQFDEQLRSAEGNKRNRSDDPRVQNRIEKMFADTQKLLGRFLSANPVSELRTEVNQAARGS